MLRRIRAWVENVSQGLAEAFMAAKQNMGVCSPSLHSIGECRCQRAKRKRT